MHLGTSTIPIQIVARRASFPGLRDGYEPMLVVARPSLAHVDPTAERVEELWTTADTTAAALAALRADRVGANYQISTDTFLTYTGLRPVTWIFNYLRALAVLIGVVAFTGVPLALTARARQQALAYHMARRMGLRRGQNVRSLALELGTLVGLGCLLGLSAAAGAVALVYRLIDLYQALPPPPSYPLPVAASIYTLTSAALLTCLGAWALQRLYDRSQPATHLRE